MNIAVIGAGGVGGYFGGKLAKAGNPVTFVARGEHGKAMLSTGLKVKSLQGDFFVQPVTVVEDIDGLEKPDLVLLGVKAWQVKEVAQRLRSVIHENTMVLTLQNGVLAAGEVSEVLGAKHALAGLCRIISKIESPGVINHFGVDPLIVFGEINSQMTDRVQKIHSMFENAGFKSQISTDIQADLWKKFINICVSGLLAVTRSNYGEIREIKETRRMMFDLLTEIYTLSRKMGIIISADYVEKSMQYIDSFPYDSNSSLARDVWNGKPSELEYQNGTVVKLADQYGVEVPVNRFIYNSILPMELRARKIAQMNR